ncbi:unnamed protein product [Pleuronectes platessa]|uniref:Uncharacterized protein n=1 Tax=Pleuronectes platessa TaxID=8262 RepID=A0A9N7TQA8_PLEPL|nr:unnamed protein product [Pleuronectes platessa]
MRHQQHLSLAFQSAATEIGPMGVKEVGARVCLDNYRAKKGRCLCIGTHAFSQPSSPCARVLFAGTNKNRQKTTRSLLTVRTAPGLTEEEENVKPSSYVYALT